MENKMIFRVSSEYYDKAWYVQTYDKDNAISLVKELTEALEWRREDEEPDFDAEERFTEEDEIIEWEDM